MDGRRAVVAHPNVGLEKKVTQLLNERSLAACGGR